MDQSTQLEFNMIIIGFCRKLDILYLIVNNIFELQSNLTLCNITCLQETIASCFKGQLDICKAEC